MGEIVHLTDRVQRPASRAELNPQTGQGQILLFTGIRYERLSEPQPQPDPKRPRGRRRA